MVEQTGSPGQSQPHQGGCGNVDIRRDATFAVDLGARRWNSRSFSKAASRRRGGPGLAVVLVPRVTSRQNALCRERRRNSRSARREN